METIKEPGFGPGKLKQQGPDSSILHSQKYSQVATCILFRNAMWLSGIFEKLTSSVVI